MPDWLSHMLIGLILAELFRVKKKSVVMLGAILPDLVVKISLIGLFIHLPAWFRYFVIHSHVPVICILMTLFIALVFRYDQVRILLWMNLGVLSHFISDLTMKHFTGGMLLFFPFTIKEYSLNLFWADYSLILVLPLLAVYLVLLYYNKKTVASED